MPVLCECINVLVPVEALELRYPGGVAGYERAVPNATFCCDGTLTRVGFMDPADTQVWGDLMQAHGLELLDAREVFADMAIVEVPGGLTRPCPWLELGHADGVVIAWIVGEPSGQVVGTDSRVLFAG